MSRSLVVTLVVGLVLVVAFAVVAAHYWPALAQYSRVSLAVILGITLYGAGLAAVSLRRVIDPRLSIPILAWLAIVAFWIMSILGKKDDDISSSSSSSSSSSRRGDGMGRPWAVFSTIMALGVYGGGLALMVYLARTPRAAAATTPSTVAKQPIEAAPKPPGPVPMNDIITAPDLAAALAIAMPNMSDNREAPSPGATQLLRWAVAKLAWRDVAVTKDEITPARVEKDPAKAGGKRLCASGTLARIEKQEVTGNSVWGARMVTKQGDAIEIFAVGDTGDLVKRKPARFCGVVVGRLDLGGKPATLAIGMFDVPANRR